MQRPSLIASSLLTASMFALSFAAHAQQTGIVRFTGMIVEPPCSFSVAGGAGTHAQLQPACPRPAKGSVTFVDPQSGAALRTVTFHRAVARDRAARRANGRRAADRRRRVVSVAAVTREGSTAPRRATRAACTSRPAASGMPRATRRAVRQSRFASSHALKRRIFCCCATLSG